MKFIETESRIIVFRGCRELGMGSQGLMRAVSVLQDGKNSGDR